MQEDAAPSKQRNETARSAGSRHESELTDACVPAATKGRPWNSEVPEAMESTHLAMPDEEFERELKNTCARKPRARSTASRTDACVCA